MTQTAILILSSLAIWLVSGKTPNRWGYACGLCSQPLWLIETARAEQWGMFALSIFYTAAWMRGVWHHWILEQK